MANEVFISYSRKDFTKVREIKDTLDREVGIDCWMDLNGIESGDQFKKVIIAAINRHDTLLFMKTSDSMQSKYAMKELNFAESKDKRIILVDLDHSPMTDDFQFDYGDKDNIDWSNSLQRDKLIRNLKSWFPQVQDQKETSAILEAKYKQNPNNVKKQNELAARLEVLQNKALETYNTIRQHKK